MAAFETSFGDITGAITSIIGGSTEVSQRAGGTATGTARRTEQVKLDEAAIQKIIQDVLGGAEGLASIFAGEQSAGIFDSSVAAQAAGDLASKIVGELAKLTAVRETTEETEQITDSAQKQETETGGIIGAVGDIFGF